MKYSDFSPKNEFIARHIGPQEADVQQMLARLGFSSLDEMAKKVFPTQILSKHHFTDTGEGISEYDILKQLKTMMGKNKIYQTLIGMGYHDTITPTVIQRNILESPVWYTAYTPYQAEIAQGRLESLLNFQTMVKDLTGMEISNSSLLDEGTAAAEAMAMAHNLCKNGQATSFVVSPDMHPHVIEVLKTRSEPLGLEMILKKPADFDFSKAVFAAFFQYPTTEGHVENYADISKKFHDQGALVVASTDLLALTLLTPPGEWGADIVVGNSQRFGVPLGYGGPHAAFLATKDSHKRLMPGRIVGMSVDSQGKPALRLALQTREQHIRREKATSNICTAQVLLANMAAMYAVYHGPKGLKRIAQRVHRMTAIVAEGLKKLGFEVETKNFFDTLTVKTDKSHLISGAAENLKMNFRLYPDGRLGIALDETCDLNTVDLIFQAFNQGVAPSFSAAHLDASVKAEFPTGLKRESEYLTHEVFNSHHSETELLRYIHTLQNRDLTLTPLDDSVGFVHDEIKCHHGIGPGLLA